MGLVAGSNVSDVSFTGIKFEYAAWNGPVLNSTSGAFAYVPQQAGLHFTYNDRSASTPIPGALSSLDCRRVRVKNCTFAHMGGAAVDFGGVAQGNAVESCNIAVVSATEVQFGSAVDPLTTNNALMSNGNILVESTIYDVAKVCRKSVHQ